MAMDNTVTLAGNVTRDPELRYTATSTAVATFGLAVNRRWQNRQTNEWEEQVSFFDIVCWRQLGENVADSLTKGMRVVVAGRLDQRSWETDDGQKRSKVEVTADEVAASLKWATVEVERNEKSEGYNSGGDGGGGSRPARSAPAARGRRESVPSAQPAPSGFDPEEEPF